MDVKDILNENKILKQYNSELQAQNKAKDKERQTLEKQIERLTNSRKNQIQANQKRCQKYEIEIRNLQLRIKNLQSISRESREKFSKKESSSIFTNDCNKIQNENQALNQKVNYMEKQISKLQQANHILKEEILNKMYTGPTITLQQASYQDEASYFSPLQIRYSENASRSFYRQHEQKSNSLVEERWKTLKAKIKILEKENQALRSKVRKYKR